MHAVFLRAVNVGGRNVFRPAQLARELAHLDVVNVGAAGTFVVRGKASAARIRREILARMPFRPWLAVVPAAEVQALVRSKPFAGVTFSKGLRGWVAVGDGPPKLRPKLPISSPPEGPWSVGLDRVTGRFALGRWQRRPGGFLFPGDVVEKQLGLTSTTRWWETIVRVAELLHPRDS